MRGKFPFYFNIKKVTKKTTSIQGILKLHHTDVGVSSDHEQSQNNIKLH